MKLPRVLRRIAWPLIATAASILLYLSSECAADASGLDQEAMQLVAGSVAYFAGAWLGGRLVGVALERAASSQRRVPKLRPRGCAAGSSTGRRRTASKRTPAHREQMLPCPSR